MNREVAPACDHTSDFRSGPEWVTLGIRVDEDAGTYRNPFCTAINPHLTLYQYFCAMFICSTGLLRWLVCANSVSGDTSNIFVKLLNHDIQEINKLALSKIKRWHIA